MNTSTRFSTSFVGSFPNNPNGHLAFKNLSDVIRKLGAAGGIKYRIRRYGRGRGRKEIFAKQVADSVSRKTGVNRPNAWRSNFWRPALKFCERFDVYLTIQ
jgi:hypothetical protein